MYRAILELANKCKQNGKWRPTPGVGGGLGTVGGAWNVIAGTDDVADRTGSVVVVGSRCVDGSENVSGDGTKLKKRESGWPQLLA